MIPPSLQVTFTGGIAVAQPHDHTALYFLVDGGDLRHHPAGTGRVEHLRQPADVAATVDDPAMWPAYLIDERQLYEGAAALIVTTEEMAKKLGKPYVKIIGSAVGTDTIALAQREDMTKIKAATIAADRALKMAGKKLGDVSEVPRDPARTLAFLDRIVRKNLMAKDEDRLSVAVVVEHGGFGAAALLCLMRDLSERGDRTTVILGAREKDLLILTDELADICDNLELCTDDGSLGFKGFVTDRLRQLIDGDGPGRPDSVIAIGPMPMMRAVTETTRDTGIPTLVSLDPLMIDGTGMCGGCRVTVDNEVKFACVDGPFFDAHQVDFEEAVRRNKMYAAQENAARERAACRSLAIGQN